MLLYFAESPCAILQNIFSYDMCQGRHPRPEDKITIHQREVRYSEDYAAFFETLADYERIDTVMDNGENYSKLFESIIEFSGDLPADQFYRIIQ